GMGKTKANFLNALRKTMQPSGAKPGSVEAMIDDLIHVSGVPNRYSTFGVSSTTDPIEMWNDPRYAKLALQGFAAVPALIEHLEDDRITHALQTGENMFVPRYLTVGEFAQSMLGSLAGDELPPGDPLVSVPITKQAAQAWWERASLHSEEVYLLTHALR